MSQKTRASYHERLVAVLKSIAGQTMYISTPRIFFDLTHDLVLAAMISQLIYWSDRTTRSDGFVFKSSRDWYDEIGATRYAVQKFKKLPFVLTKIVRANGSPTTHYRIDMDKLIEELLDLDLIHDPKSGDPQSEFGQTTARNQANHQLISDDPLFENDQTLTDITTDNTTEITNIKRGCSPENFIISELADQETGNDKQDTETPPSEVDDPKPKKDREEFKQFTLALADISGYDISLKKTSSRVLVAARQLVQAGYTLADLQSFLPYWKEKDWRWQKNSQLPTPEDVLLNICRARNHKNRFRRWYS
jgi:hypothetical protein